VPAASSAPTVTVLWTEKPVFCHESSKLNPLLAQQFLVSKEGDHLVTEEKLSRLRVDVRHGYPGALAIPPATRNQSVTCWKLGQTSLEELTRRR